MLSGPDRARPLRRWFALVAAALVLGGSALFAFRGWGSLWRFERMDQHRFTAMSLLHGLMRIRGSILHVGHDDQVWNGAGYTNWSYGVPLLQVPFHALLGRVGSLRGFFPDRAIYFFYFCAFAPVLWAAFDRTFAGWLADGTANATPRRHVLSCAATWATLTSALYPLMCGRFLIYEETLCYFEICELVALSAYVFARGSPGIASTLGLAGAAGFGLLVRPTGAVYLGVWGALVALERRPKRTLAFVLAATPFVGFWLFSNVARTGSALGLGYGNTNPDFDYQIALHRFGSLCIDSAPHALSAAERLFAGFFVYVSTSGDRWLDACNFTFERRSANHLPFFDPVVPLVLGWMLVHDIRARRLRLALCVPYAAMFLLFITFVERGQEFAWRYTADFWPLIALGAVLWLQGARRPTRSRADLPIALSLVVWGTVSFLRFVEPWDPSASPPELLSEAATAAIAEDFHASLWDRDAPAPSRLACGEPVVPFYKNGKGWTDGCAVDTYTNVYLGVPAKADDHYRIRLQAEGVASLELRVYVNGRTYPAPGSAGLYEAEVTIPQASLVSPIVLATVEWARALEPPPVKLLWIELD
jgi:hypothetical protein